MKILYCTTELYPYIKTGGLADVAACLSQNLDGKQAKVTLIVPLFPKFQKAVKKKKKIKSITHEGLGETYTLYSGLLGKQKVIGVKSDHFEEKDGNPYVDSNGRNYKDNFETFTIFSHAIGELAKRQKRYAFDVIQLNDWQTGMAAAYVHHAIQEGQQPIPKVAFTIHNIAYPGIFENHEFDRLDLPKSMFDIEGIEYHNKISFLKAGIYYADKVFTVSPSYCQETATSSEVGMGFEGLLNTKKQEGNYKGIVNGVDYKVWNPATDVHIFKKYDASKISLKYENKQALQKQFGLSEGKDTFLIGMVGRIDYQKGWDFILEVMPKLLENLPVQLIALGTGDPQMTEDLKVLSQQYPQSIAFINEYDDSRSHQVFAASDAFLVPSRFEPCGLTQLYAMKYGTVPIANKVGGLQDTISDLIANEASGTGFFTQENTAQSLENTIRQAYDLYQKSEVWSQARLNAMRQDFSWQKSVEAYLASL